MINDDLLIGKRLFTKNCVYAIDSE